VAGSALDSVAAAGAVAGAGAGRARITIMDAATTGVGETEMDMVVVARHATSMVADEAHRRAVIGRERENTVSVRVTETASVTASASVTVAEIGTDLEVVAIEAAVAAAVQRWVVVVWTMR
jgi:hypothetical protein